MPFGVKVLQACPTAGHLPSSSLYPACRAPYLIVTACSDDKLRYWYCQVAKRDNFDGQFSYFWTEWSLTSDQADSALEMDGWQFGLVFAKLFAFCPFSGQILSVSSAYSCRFACAFDPMNTFDTSKSEMVNIEVGIYECESTGGTEWVLEDRLPLRNIRIPRVVHQMQDYELQKESPVLFHFFLHIGTLKNCPKTFQRWAKFCTAVQTVR